jgi:exonuclease III
MVRINNIFNGAVNNDLNDIPQFDLTNNLLHDSVYANMFHDLNLSCQYYSESAVRDEINNINNNFFSLFSVNIQSLASKFNELINFISNISVNKSKIDVLCLQETWCNNFDRFNIVGYNVFFAARSNGTRGGSCIYLKNFIEAEQLTDSKFFKENLIECTVVKAKINNLNTILCSLYRPNCHSSLNNDQQITLFLEHFNNMLELLEASGLPIVIQGDFNLNLFHLSDANSYATKLLDLVTSFGYIQCISKATRLTNHSSTLIDLTFIKNLIPNHLFSGVISTDFSDHYTTFSAIGTDKVKKKKLPLPKSRLANNDTKLAFLNSLSALSWENVCSLDDVNLAYDKFYEIFDLHYNLCFPWVIHHNNKELVPKNPFMFSGLLRCRKNKENLSRIAKINPTLFNINKYNRYRNCYSKSVRTAKKVYLRNKLYQALGDSKRTWQVIKESLNIPPKQNNVPKIVVNEISITDDILIANKFNEYFSNIGPALADSLPLTNHNFEDYLPPPAERSFFMIPITELTMLNYILSTKPKLGHDDNQLSMKTLHDVATAICKPLTHIFNLSIESGTFPEGMKISRGIPIFKKGSPFSLTNYRVVAMINSFSKVFEKIWSDRLISFFDENNFFIKTQFGFRKNTSTQHALSAIINEITRRLNDNKHVLVVCLDIQKCFDSVDREILYRKLHNAGVRGHMLSWIRSYFTNRKQRIFINGVSSSNLCDLLLGVLQGSILGVLFFLVFINDIPFATELLCSMLFADDNTCLLSSDSLNNLINLANIELNNLLHWYTSNRLVLHPSKTKAFIYRPPRTGLDLNADAYGRTFLPIFLNLNNPNEHNLTKIIPITIVPNPEESSIRLLGIQIDEKLNYKEHFKYLHGKVAKAVFSLKIMRHLLDKKHLTLLYNAYLRSALDYGSALFTTASLTTMKPIILLQKKAIRLVCGADYRAHTAPLFKQEKLLKFEDIITFNICRFMHDFRFGKLPEIFDNEWLRNNQIHGYPVRNQEDFFIPTVNKQYLSSFPLFQFPRIWNSLPGSLKSIISRNTFKKKLYDHLIDLI